MRTEDVPKNFLSIALLGLIASGAYAQSAALESWSLRKAADCLAKNLPRYRKRLPAADSAWIALGCISPMAGKLKK
jgi:hypothetical protein